MPIRFRCVYCNQLLGIAHRKAGTIVRCTSCEGQLIVPEPSDSATEAAPKEPKPAPADRSDGAGPAAFEAAEFDAFLEPLSTGGGPAVAAPPAPPAQRAPTLQEKSPVPMPAPVVSLTRRGLAVAIVALVLGVGLAFTAGLFVGHAMR